MASREVKEMTKTQENARKRAHCEELFIFLDKSVDEIAEMTGVKRQVIYRWHQMDKWAEKKQESRQIERNIEMNLRRALNKGLKAYADNPEDKDLQSLVSLLRQFKEKNKPTLAYKDNILKFIDGSVDFFLTKDMTETADVFKSIVVELAEYLLSR
jgi:predicted DNA-binding protein YlxM (UPF0122 family)